MSRRTAYRREPDDRRVTVVCTDRGQHPAAALGMLAVSDAGELLEVGGRVARGSDQPALPLDLPPDAHARRSQSSARDVDGRKVLRYQCSRCGRDVPLRWDTAQAAVSALIAAGFREFDISAT